MRSIRMIALRAAVVFGLSAGLAFLFSWRDLPAAITWLSFDLVGFMSGPSEVNDQTDQMFPNPNYLFEPSYIRYSPLGFMVHIAPIWLLIECYIFETKKNIRIDFFVIMTIIFHLSNNVFNVWTLLLGVFRIENTEKMIIFDPFVIIICSVFAVIISGIYLLIRSAILRAKSLITHSLPPPPADP